MENKIAPVDINIDKNYDSEFCGSIPLHLVNLTQPHGILLILDKEDLKIVQASENADKLFSMSIEDLLDQPISTFLPQEEYADIQKKILHQNSRDKIPFILTFSVDSKEKGFTALIHPKEAYIIIELEENNPSVAYDSFLKLYQQIKFITSLFRQASTSAEIAQLAANEIKSLTGFDRVLVYQFDPKWNGSVIAQAKEASMDDYMGLRFPASDVPKQARDLYFSNPYRLIPTWDYTPVRLIPIVNPLTQKFTDLSESNLRSVATVHLEYLANLNVKASMSLPLIIDNKLWGLISCHHKAEKNPSYEMRSCLELLSGIISAQLAAKEKESSIMLQVKLRSIQTLILEKIYSSSTFAEGIKEAGDHIKTLLDLSGLVVLFDGEIWKTGLVPDTQEIKDLLSWLRRHKTEQVYATDTLPKYYVQSKNFTERASGLIAIPINSEQGEFILGFRPEVIRTVNWGGDPNQAIQMDPNGKTYHPRNSFATYKETVKFTSLPWHAEELEAASAFRNAMLEKIVKER